MQTLHNPVKKVLATLIADALTNLGENNSLTISQLALSLTDAPSFELGHMAFPCFLLAKEYKTNPAKMALALKDNLKGHPLIREVKENGPYLNFFFNMQELGPMVGNAILSNEMFKRTLVSSPERVMIEYSQPNTHKELHVGHMRNLCLGNALVRLNRYVGHDVKAVTYPGDVGTHVAKCLWYLKYHNKEEAPTTGPKGPWLGEMYSKAYNLLEDQRGTEHEEKNRQELTAILKQLEKKDGPYYSQWKETREWSIDLMKSVYAWADVTFDRWFFESECDAPSLEMARKLYQEGKLVESEGAIGMDLSEDKLGFCLLIKSDGTGLYATKDVMLAQLKFEEYGLDRSLYIVDKRQALHFKQVFKVLERLGHSLAKNCVHIEYDFVELPSGPMSSRKGNIIPLTDLIHQMEETITRDYLERYRGVWPDEEIKETAKVVANGAIKYGMIRMDNNRKIVFEMSDWLKLDGETGPYLQYVSARINSLAEKLNAQEELDENKHGAILWQELKLPVEEVVLVKLSQFNDIAFSAATGFKTPLLCAYLYELGKLFNAFYHDCPIGKAETKNLMRARLALAVACKKTMEQGLALLGIKAPRRM